jgi:hypothetical protein
MDHRLHHDSRPFDSQCPACCETELTQNPSSIAKPHLCPPSVVAQVASVRASDWGEALLLQAAVDEPPIGGRRSDLPDLAWWMSLVDPPERAARALPTASAIAVGLARAYQQCQERTYRNTTMSRPLERLAPHVDKHLADLWCDIAILATLPAGIPVIGMRAEIEKRASKRPMVWARSLEWILLVGPRINEFDVGITLALADQHPFVREALGRCTRSDVFDVRHRAIGIQALAEGRGPLEATLLDALTGALDARRDVFPRPLDTPSRTWLADAGLEDLMRGAGKGAVRDFASYVAVSGAADEEMVTATLLAKLEQHFDGMTEGSLWASAGSPQLEVASRAVPKKEERKIGADIGIVVDVDIPRHLRIRLGDLVQVKKAEALIPSQSQRNAWKINGPQLKTLLGQSATAVYWLIAREGEVLVVPAKFLSGIGQAAGRSGSQFTVGHADVRHVAVPLHRYLADLVVGLWLGSSDAATLAAADGSHGATRPRHVLTIRVSHPVARPPRPRSFE